jgi:hypothetical protein
MNIIFIQDKLSLHISDQTKKNVTRDEGEGSRERAKKVSSII